MRLAVLMIAATAATACSHHIHSPPTRALPAESVATVGKGRVGIGAETALSGRHAVLQVPLDPWLASGGARVRFSPHEDVDLAIDAQVMRILGDSAGNVHQNIYAGRFGVKVRVLPWLAVGTGLGGGFHAAGSFISPDIGLIGGWENRYAVPFLSLRGLLSAPLQVRVVDTTEAGEEDGPFLERPLTTGGFAAALGLRVPLPPGEDPNQGVRGSLFLLAPAFTLLDDPEEWSIFIQQGIGAEITF